MFEGSKKFKRVVIVGGKNGKVTSYTPPCGVCRQMLRDYCDPETFDVVIAIDEDNYQEFKLKDLLPHSFGPENLEE